MKAIRSNAKEILTSNYKEYSDGSQTFREWVECESQSDPTFYAWLFEEEFENEFDANLTEEHREAFDKFLSSIQVTTLEELRDLINEADEWKISFNEIIEFNEWEDDTDKDYGICHTENKELYFSDSMEAVIRDLNN